VLIDVPHLVSFPLPLWTVWVGERDETRQRGYYRIYLRPLNVEGYNRYCLIDFTTFYAFKRSCIWPGMIWLPIYPSLFGTRKLKTHAQSTDGRWQANWSMDRLSYPSVELWIGVITINWISLLFFLV
jgi:hypothetical protein